MANILKNSGSRLEKKKRTRLPLSVWLAFLLLVTLTVGSTLARYNTSVSGDTTARVAKFQMTTATGYEDNAKTVQLHAGSGGAGTYEFTITNDSEVAVRYSVIVKNVPANVSVMLGDETLISTGSGTLTFTAKQLGIGAADTCTLTFQALDDAVAVSQQVTIKIHTEQVD